MAKIRVYELAKQLNMENKELVEQLIMLDYPVKSPMSTLTEEEVEAAKAKIVRPEAKAVEEKRVRPTVIRRRKKARPEEPEETPAEAPLEVETAPADEVPAPAPAEIEAVEAPAPPEAEPPAEPAPITMEAQPEPTIEEPAAPEPEPPAPAPTVDEAQVPAEPTPAEAEAPEPEATAPEAAPPEAAPPEAGEETPAPKPVRKKPRDRKDAPARIIKMPERVPVLPPQEPPVPGPGRPAGPPGVPPAPGVEESDAARRGKKRKKGKKTQPPDDATLFNRVGFRKREVMEHKDIYDTGRGRRGKKGPGKRTSHTEITTPKAIKRRIKVGEAITVADLAKRMGVKASEIVKSLMAMGVMAGLNQAIDFDAASLIGTEFGYELEKSVFEEQEYLHALEDKEEDLVPRPPVVTIMGHVDHGKTSLLDAIRQTNVTAGEAGGITQHIGAYHVALDTGDIVFLDTPGHEAFTTMRARGAQVTDLVVLVVAADDGVMEQTKEAVNHSRAAGVPILVAVNKIDKPDADPDRVKRELGDLGLVPEDWGGETIFVPVSAKEKIGVDSLLEMIVLQSEVLELRANPNKLARGRIVEARLDKGRGPVATVLVTEGTLRTGDVYVCGTFSGRVRALTNDRGEPIDSAGPSIPAEVQGLSGVPEAGDELIVMENEKQARQVAEHRQNKRREEELVQTSKVSLEGLFEKIKEGEAKELNLIIRGDVHGSVEAINEALVKLSTDAVKVNVLLAATGAITESDILLASASNAIIIGFNMRPNPKVVELAEKEGVDIRTYDVIYEVISEVRDAMTGLLESTFREQTVGRAEVRDTFHVPKVGTIAGCSVLDGKIERGSRVHLLRDGVVQFTGTIGSLRRFKEDVKEVEKGYECGIGLDGYQDVKVGDIIEAFRLEEIRPEL
jgi:translation initiation factor IF-2